MPLIAISATGLDTWRQRFAAAYNTASPATQSAVEAVCREVGAELRAASPWAQHEEGSSQNALDGDEPGHLADSYVPEVESTDYGAIGKVYTTQPTKMRFVRYGTGIYGPSGARIYPTTKLALFWASAAHPYRSVAGIKPNDFVTPVVEAALAEAGQTLMDLIHEELFAALLFS